MGEKDAGKRDDSEVLKLLHCEGYAKKVKKLVKNIDGLICKTKQVSNPFVNSVQIHSMDDKDSRKGDDEKKADAGGVKDNCSATTVLKLDVHCEDCAVRIKKFVANIDGVKAVMVDSASGKLTVKGKLDSMKLQERLEKKTKRKVVLIPPLPKEDDGGDNKSNDKDHNKEGGSNNKSKDSKKKPHTDDKKGKEWPVSTAVLKFKLHCGCHGCIHKIDKNIRKFKGVESVTIDGPRNLATVNGTMDMKELTHYLKEKLKCAVDMVPAKKVDGGEKKDKTASPGRGKEGKQGSGGGEKKDSAAKTAGRGRKVEVNKMSVSGYGPLGGGDGEACGDGYQACGDGYRGGYVTPVVFNHPHAPQMFSDENPNACSIL